MAGSAVTNLQVLVNTPGVEKLPKLASSLKRLTVSTKEAGLSFTKLSAGLKQQAIDGGKSINNTRSLANAWKELAASVKFGSKEFEVATARAKRLNAQLVKMEGRKGGGMGRMARTAGAVAGAGVFGGPEGAIGAAIGGLMPGGGPISAAVGGAIGAQVGMVRQAIGSTAEYSAALGRQRKALKLVINDTNAYAKSQAFLEEKSEKLAIPQDVIVRQFTALTASVKGAGHSVEDAEKVFKSIASGIRGTGGSLQDMKAAMTATAQVFSKGKVSAEELRQQLGERLPGAFTIFAESMGKTPAELDKALEQGQVTLQDFMNFSETLFKKYGKNAEILAAGPEAAGDRLQTALSSLKDNVGALLRPIGAAFQDMATSSIKWLDELAKKVRAFAEAGPLRAARKAVADAELTITQIDQRLEYHKGRGTALDTERYNELMEIRRGAVNKLNDANVDLFRVLQDIDGTQDDIAEGGKKLGETGKSVWADMKAGASSYLDSIKDVSKQIEDATVNAFKKMEDSLVEFVTTGKMNFRDFALSVINDLTRIAVRQAMMSSFSGIPILGNLLKNEKGNIYAQNKIVPFAKGGVVTSPHIFPFKNGIGLMSEAGPEAIMPLRRGAGGRLGVEASGGGTSVVVNVDASGSTVEGDAQDARNLGRAISSAVQQELVRQRRPGGLLSA